VIGLSHAARPGKDGGFASSADYEQCRRLHKRHGTSYYFSSRLFPAEIRRKTDALYGFVRVADEYCDDLTLADPKALGSFRLEFMRGMDGVRPDSPILRAFCDVVAETAIPLEEPLLFLDAMAADFETFRYGTYRDLRGYMRGSAVTVGTMMCAIVGAKLTNEVCRGAQALAEAMQLTNFLRDVGEDLDRGRIYLPLEDLASFGVDEQSILDRRPSAEFKNLMRFEIARARSLYALADTAIEMLPVQARKPVRLASCLYSRILRKIEEHDYDVFGRRARTTKVEKLRLALPILVSS